MLVRLNACGRQLRDRIIELMAEDGVATNVHYKPLPLLTAYRNLGFDIADFPERPGPIRERDHPAASYQALR